jgi:CheY-like chemotaxis protein
MHDNNLRHDYFEYISILLVDSFVFRVYVIEKNVMAAASKLHILLADDDKEDFYLFKEALKQLDPSVTLTHVENSVQLLKYLDEVEIPDVIVLDVHMPYKPVIESLSDIKMNEKYNHLPVIIFSTSGDKETIDACYKAGATLYLVKPYTFPDLVNIIRKIVQTNWDKASENTISAN